MPNWRFLHKVPDMFSWNLQLPFNITHCFDSSIFIGGISEYKIPSRWVFEVQNKGHCSFISNSVLFLFLIDTLIGLPLSINEMNTNTSWYSFQVYPRSTHCATSFPGSLLFPPKASFWCFWREEESDAFGGKKRDPGNEVAHYLAH